MEYDKNKAHYIAITGILVKDGKYLIVKRANWETAFPGKWTVPGGKLEVLDYALEDKDTDSHWYNVLENALRRECKEEVGLKIKNIGYVTSMTFIRKSVPVLIISLYAEPDGNLQVNLCKDLTEYKWVTPEEAKQYDLIEGIYEEIEMLDKHIKQNTKQDNQIGDWEKNNFS